MRIKPIEIVLGLLMIGIGLADIISGRVFTKYGHESPITAAYLMLAGGIAIPVLAWFLRSPSRKKGKPDE